MWMGLTWLETHNPIMDWRSRSVNFTTNSRPPGITSTLLRADVPPFVWPPTPVRTVSTVAPTHVSGTTPVSAPVRTASTVAPTHVSTRTISTIAPIETTSIVPTALASETNSTLAQVSDTVLIASISNSKDMAVMSTPEQPYVVALFHQNTMISLMYLRRKMLIACLNIAHTIVQLT